MAEECAVGKVSQIPSGEGRTFVVRDKRMAVFHTRGGDVFATQSDCPHRGGPLADGLTDDVAVVCPLHDRAYNLRTGAGIGNDCNIMVYPVRITEDGTILIVPYPAMAMVAAD